MSGGEGDAAVVAMNPPDPLVVQGVPFAVGALTGVALGLLLDAYRAVCRAFRPARLAHHVLDVGLVAAALPVVAGGMLAANWGALRVYPLLAFALGATLYLTLASPLLLPAAVWTITRVARWSVAIGRAVAAPIRAVANGCSQAARWLWGWLRRRAADGAPPDSTTGRQPGDAAGRTNEAPQTSDREEGGGAQGQEKLGRGRDRRRVGGGLARDGRSGGRRTRTGNAPRGGGRRL